MRKLLLFCTMGLVIMAGTHQAAAAVTFSTFVTAGDISAAEGQNQTIAFNYAGDKFVGSVSECVNDFETPGSRN